MKQIYSLPAFLLASYTSLVCAQPQIQSVTGTPSEGATVSISGSGFGDTSSRKLVFDAPVGATYGGIVEGKTVPTGGSYPFLQNTYLRPGAVKLSGTNTRFSGADGVFRVTGGGGYLHNPVALGGAAPPSSYNQLYVSYWFKPDASIDGGSHSSKFLRVWDNNDGLGSRISWTQMHLTYDGGAEIAWGSWGGTTGQWNRLEFYINADSHQIRAWTNGKLIHDVKDFQRNSQYSGIGLHLERIGFDPGGESPPKIDFSFSDVYASNSPARVELCASSTWSSCLIRELQQTVSWSGSKIDIKLARGRLAGSSSLYLYVVDAQGRVNSSGSLICANNCALQPMAPSAVSVR